MKMKIWCDTVCWVISLLKSVCVKWDASNIWSTHCSFNQKVGKKVEIHNEGSALGRKIMHLVSQVRINEENNEKITYGNHIQTWLGLFEDVWFSCYRCRLFAPYFLLRISYSFFFFFIKTAKYGCACQIQSNWLMLHRNMHRPFVNSHYPDLLKYNAFKSRRKQIQGDLHLNLISSDLRLSCDHIFI